MNKLKCTSLNRIQKSGLLLFSFFVVAFGQPSWSSFFGVIASTVGFACFWRVLLATDDAKERFCLGMSWYTAVQIVQLSWFLSHPYAYIYGVLLFCAWLIGLQWGLLSIWITPRTFQKISSLLALAGSWVILEWSRLFILSGLPFNPIGIFMSSSFYTMQMASMGGVYGLSFLVLLTNAFFLRAWIEPFFSKWLIAVFLFLLPYTFGWIHVQRHAKNFDHSPLIGAILVQPFLPIEENMAFQSAEEARQFVLNEWKQILQTLPKHTQKKVDLIVLPEYVVPYGTFHPVFPLLLIQNMFQEIFGERITPYLKEESPYVDWVSTDKGWQQLASNAYISQLLSYIFNADLVIGLEDNVYVDKEKCRVEAYSAAFHFTPSGDNPDRYEKRILVPMGEYIPFEWCRSLAKKYGIQGSFTGGKSARVFSGPVPLGTSICYEEMYGHLMRENRLQGAELLVNLTNDGWYPGSKLCQQHFDHARLRTVENGIPLVRSCNTGITGAVDSLGQTIETLNDGRTDSLYVKIPLYTYKTLYTQWGDFAILGIASGCVLQKIFRKYFVKKKNHQ